MQPQSFDRALSQAWDEWVLNNGLPELPARLAASESVPIAYWSGPEFGAVVHIVDCDHDPYCDGDDHYATDVRCFRRTSDSWEEARAGTGTDWAGGVTTKVDVPDDHIEFDDGPSMVTGWGFEWQCFTVTGFAGAEAAWIELTQQGETVRRRLDVPSGLFVVVMSDARPADIRVLDITQQVKAAYTVPAPRTV